MAVAQLLRTNQTFKAHYVHVQCINEYIEMGHMELVKSTENDLVPKNGSEIKYNSAYLPHHGDKRSKFNNQIKRCF